MCVYRIIMTEGDDKNDNDQNNASDGAGAADDSNNASGDDNADYNQNNISPIDEAKAINKETKDLLEKREKIIAREEKLHAEIMVGGHTIAGRVEKKETADEKYNREAKIRYEGSGMDPTPDDSVTTYG